MTFSRSKTTLATWILLWLALTVSSGSAVGAGYKLLSETRYPVDSPLPVVNSLIRTRDQGYLIVGEALTRQLWIVKTNRDGDKEWDRVIDGKRYSSQRGIFALGTDDGGHLVIGKANAVEFMDATEVAGLSEKEIRLKGSLTFVAKFSAKGGLERRVLLGGPIEVRRAMPVCGVRTKDGYVLVGKKSKTYLNQPTPTGLAGVSHPWIAKFDNQNAIVWETLLEDDKEELYSADDVLGPNFCSGPILDENGTVTFALGIRLRPTLVRNGVRVVTGPGTVDKSRFATFVAQVDANGNKLAWARIEDGLRASLFPTKSGFVVIDHPAPLPERGIRRTWLDATLKIIKQEESRFNGFSFELETALPSKNGGFHFLGNFVTPFNGRGRTAIAQLRPNGELVGIRTFDGWNLPSWGAMAIAPGGSEDEVAVLLRRDEQVKLLRLRYQD